MRILIVEDGQFLARQLKRSLEQDCEAADLAPGCVAARERLLVQAELKAQANTRTGA